MTHRKGATGRGCVFRINERKYFLARPSWWTSEPGQNLTCPAGYPGAKIETSYLSKRGFKEPAREQPASQSRISEQAIYAYAAFRAAFMGLFCELSKTS
jgi:hypothetical protein